MQCSWTKIIFPYTVNGFFFKITITLLILSFDDVTLQFCVWNVYFCVLKYIKFKFYEKPVQQNYIFFITLGIDMIGNKDEPVKYKLFTCNFIEPCNCQ